MVALPHSPENVRPVTELPSIPIDQVVIGSCTNGRLEDLQQAAKILKGKKGRPRGPVRDHPGHPARSTASHAGRLLEIFIEAEAAVSTPTCGPCLGGHMGILAAGERAVATTNRNFRRAHGPSGKRSLPEQSGGCRGFGSCRAHRSPGDRGRFEA